MLSSREEEAMSWLRDAAHLTYVFDCARPVKDKVCGDPVAAACTKLVHAQKVAALVKGDPVEETVPAQHLTVCPEVPVKLTSTPPSTGFAMDTLAGATPTSGMREAGELATVPEAATAPLRDAAHWTYWFVAASPEKTKFWLDPFAVFSTQLPDVHEWVGEVPTQHRTVWPEVPLAEAVRPPLVTVTSVTNVGNVPT